MKLKPKASIGHRDVRTLAAGRVKSCEACVEAEWTALRQSNASSESVPQGGNVCSECQAIVYRLQREEERTLRLLEDDETGTHRRRSTFDVEAFRPPGQECEDLGKSTLKTARMHGSSVVAAKQ